MSTTLTIRTDDHLQEALRQRAEALNKSISDVVREILREALQERPVSARAGHLKGRLDGSSQTDYTQDPWRDQLRERNWRR